MLATKIHHRPSELMLEKTISTHDDTKKVLAHPCIGDDLQVYCATFIPEWAAGNSVL